MNTFLLSTIKMLLSSIFKFGRTTQNFPKLALFHHTLNITHKVLRIPLCFLRFLSQSSPVKKINRDKKYNQTDNYAPEKNMPIFLEFFQVPNEAKETIYI